MQSSYFSLDTVTVVDVLIILLYSSDSRTLILRLLVIFSKHPRWTWICDHINQFGYLIKERWRHGPQIVAMAGGGWGCPAP